MNSASGDGARALTGTWWIDDHDGTTRRAVLLLRPGLPAGRGRGHAARERRGPEAARRAARGAPGAEGLRGVGPPRPLAPSAGRSLPGAPSLLLFRRDAYERAGARAEAMRQGCASSPERLMIQRSVKFASRVSSPETTAAVSRSWT